MNIFFLGEPLIARIGKTPFFKESLMGLNLIFIFTFCSNFQTNVLNFSPEDLLFRNRWIVLWRVIWHLCLEIWAKVKNFLRLSHLSCCQSQVIQKPFDKKKFWKTFFALHRNNQFQIAFSRPVTSSDFVILSSEEKTAITIKEWRSVTGQKFDSLWISELVLPASTTVCVQMVNGSSR